MKEISFDEWYNLIEQISTLENEVKSAIVFGVVSFIGFFALSLLFLLHIYGKTKSKK